MKVLIINGPNLNLLGKREQDIYGNQDFNSFFRTLKESYPEVQLSYFQSNHAGELVDKLQEADQEVDGIILNAAAYTHTSLALGDAVKAISTPVYEVHLTNTMSREEIRHISFISPGAEAIVMGFGLDSYRLALEGLLRKQKKTG